MKAVRMLIDCGQSYGDLVSLLREQERGTVVLYNKEQDLDEDEVGRRRRRRHGHATFVIRFGLFNS